MSIISDAPKVVPDEVPDEVQARILEFLRAGEVSKN